MGEANQTFGDYVGGGWTVSPLISSSSTKEGLRDTDLEAGTLVSVPRAQVRLTAQAVASSAVSEG